MVKIKKHKRTTNERTEKERITLLKELEKIIFTENNYPMCSI